MTLDDAIKLLTENYTKRNCPNNEKYISRDEVLKLIDEKIKECTE